MDGYTLFAAMELRYQTYDCALRVEFRPILSAERKRIRWILETRGTDAIGMVESIVLSHITWMKVETDHGLDDEWDLYTEELLWLLCGLWPTSWSPGDEKAWASNLRQGIRLQLYHPEVANRDCDHCKEWLYAERGDLNGNKPGTIVSGRGGLPQKRFKEPYGHLPCGENGAGCPKGTPENPRTLWEINKFATQDYAECRATNLFPDDPVTKHNAVIIRGVYDAYELDREDRRFKSLTNVNK